MEALNPRSPARHCDEITAKIDRALAETPGTPEHQARLDGMHDMEFCLDQKVRAGDLTHAEAEEALNAYINWIETGQSYMGEDPNQGKLFE